MTINFDHINVTVSDLDESTQWYQKVFGFKLAETGIYPNGLRWGIVALDDSMVCMTERRGLAAPLENESLNHVIMHFGIRIVDQAAWLETIRRCHLDDGFLETVEYPNSTSWYLRDPSGHKLEVSHTQAPTLTFPAGAELGSKLVSQIETSII